MNFVTTTDIMRYATHLFSEAAEWIGNIRELETLSDKAGKLIGIIDEHLESGAFTGEAREELFEAKADCELVQSLHKIDKLAHDELLATINLELDGLI